MTRPPDAELLDRSVRTLAWLGDAEFEREVRRRIALRGDYPTDRLNAVKRQVVSAAGQAALYDAVLPLLTEAEGAVARRAQNASVRTRSRAKRDTKAYRAATALEALVAYWAYDPDSSERLTDVLGPALEAAIDAGFAAPQPKPARG